MTPAPNELAIAAEFCELIGRGNLVEYLGLDPDVGPDRLQAALKERRRKLQGMQANPKYRDEAKFLIRHFHTLDAVLATASAHVDDMKERRLERNLPILEAVVQGMLSTGPVEEEQMVFLRQRAEELGIERSRLGAVLARLTGTEPPEVTEEIEKTDKNIRRGLAPSNRAGIQLEDMHLLQLGTPVPQTSQAAPATPVTVEARQPTYTPAAAPDAIRDLSVPMGIDDFPVRRGRAHAPPAIETPRPKTPRPVVVHHRTSRRKPSRARARERQVVLLVVGALATLGVAAMAFVSGAALMWWV